jgi:hypothetical protein
MLQRSINQMVEKDMHARYNKAKEIMDKARAEYQPGGGVFLKTRNYDVVRLSQEDFDCVKDYAKYCTGKEVTGDRIDFRWDDKEVRFNSPKGRL